MFEARRVAMAALLLLPGGLVLFFSSHSGGFYPDAIAIGALVLLVALMLRVTTAGDPFEGVSRWGAVVAAAMGLFALWQLLSWQWSDAPGRALLEFDRSLLYLVRAGYIEEYADCAMTTQELYLITLQGIAAIDNA